MNQRPTGSNVTKAITRFLQFDLLNSFPAFLLDADISDFRDDNYRLSKNLGLLL